MAVFFLNSWDVVDDIGCARASRNLCYFCVKAVNALFTGSRMKRAISPFLCFLHSPQLPSGYVKIAIENDHL